jgi:hypothetical protein
MSRLKIEALFRGVHDNRDAQGYRVAQQVLTGQFDWLQEGIVAEAQAAKAGGDLNSLG